MLMTVYFFCSTKSSSASSSKRNSRQSYGAAPIDPPIDQELPEEWQIEREEDGRFHYYNKHTGEMRQAHSLRGDLSVANSTNMSGTLSDMDTAARDRDRHSSFAESNAMSHSFLDHSTDASFRSFGSLSEPVHLSRRLSHALMHVVLIYILYSFALAIHRETGKTSQ